MRRSVTLVVLLALALGSGAPALFGSVAEMAEVAIASPLPPMSDVCDDAPRGSDCCPPGDGCTCCLHLLQALHIGPDPTPRPSAVDSLEPVTITADLALLPDDVLHVPRSLPRV